MGFHALGLLTVNAVGDMQGNFGALLADDSEASERWGRTDPLAKRQSVDWFKVRCEAKHSRG